jgi:hypothetical protein
VLNGAKRCILQSCSTTSYVRGRSHACMEMAVGECLSCKSESYMGTAKIVNGNDEFMVPLHFISA